MFKLEYNTVMDNIRNDSQLIKDKDGKVIDFLENLDISFSDTYYAIVHGKIPLEVANIIYKKYPGNPYKIRVDGGCEDWVPREHAIDQKYADSINSIIKDCVEGKTEWEEYLPRCNNARKNLKRRKDDNKFLTTYHIDTKEGLIIFLTEMKDYYLRKNNLEEIEVDKYNEIISNVTKDLLNDINPTISAFQWMTKDKENSDIYIKTLMNWSNSVLGQSMIESINNFDKAVNPFIDMDNELDDIEEYMKKVNITVSYDRPSSDGTKGCWMKITENETGNTTEYIRNNTGFSFKLNYKLEDETNFSFLHYFTKINEQDIGEHIAVSYWGKHKTIRDFRFNLTTQTIDGKPITIKGFDFINDELQKAIEYAKTITNNMKKETVKVKSKESY